MKNQENNGATLRASRVTSDILREDGHGKLHREYRINLLYLPMAIKKEFTAYREDMKSLTIAVDFHGLIAFIEEQFLDFQFDLLPEGHVPLIQHMNGKRVVHRFCIIKLAPSLRKALLSKCIEERDGDGYHRVKLSEPKLPERTVHPSTDYLYFLPHNRPERTVCITGRQKDDKKRVLKGDNLTLSTEHLVLKGGVLDVA